MQNSGSWTISMWLMYFLMMTRIERRNINQININPGLLLENGIGEQSSITKGINSFCSSYELNNRSHWALLPWMVTSLGEEQLWILKQPEKGWPTSSCLSLDAIWRFTQGSSNVAQGRMYGATRGGSNMLLSRSWFIETSLIHHVGVRCPRHMNLNSNNLKEMNQNEINWNEMKCFFHLKLAAF